MRAGLRDAAGLVGADGGRTALRDLPAEAQRYVARLEEITGVPAAIISTGSAREDTIIREDSVAAAWFGRHVGAADRYALILAQ